MNKWPEATIIEAYQHFMHFNPLLEYESNW